MFMLNLCQHSTTELPRGIMTNEHKQSALSKARCFKHSKITSSFCIQFITNEQVKLGSISCILILAVPLKL